jgi:threonylcarbamoyladenosine tRNA methylthiotransferase MtaB
MEPATTSPSRPRAALHTLGCRLNQAETGLLAERLREAGYEIVPFDAPADLGVINTCTVTREADAKSRKLVKQFIRKNPGAYVAVAGCYSQTGFQALAQIPGVDLIVGNQEKLNLLEYVRRGRNGTPLVVRDQIDRVDFTIETRGGGDLTTRPNLKIQDGCSFVCTFCVIPSARGRSRSRAFDDLLAEARALAGRGAREIVLTGVNLGTYTHEGRGIVEVVDALDAIPGVERVRISSIEPTTVPDGLLDRMADPDHALCPYLHLPAQSGSDRVLALMRRRYTRAEYLAFAEEAARRVPGLCIGTDLLAGMPGETDEDFAQTLSLLQDGPIDYAHVFPYSEREGTPAVAMPGKVDPKTRQARCAAVRRVAAQKRRLFHEAHLGQILGVLFEEEEKGVWQGYTSNYMRVALRSTENLANRLVLVRLAAVAGDVVLGERG